MARGSSDYLLSFPTTFLLAVTLCGLPILTRCAGYVLLISPVVFGYLAGALSLCI